MRLSPERRELRARAFGGIRTPWPATVRYTPAAFGGWPDRASITRFRSRMGSRSPCLASSTTLRAAISAAGPAQSAKSSSRSTPSNAATRTAISSGPSSLSCIVFLRLSCSRHPVRGFWNQLRSGRVLFHSKINSKEL